MTDELAEPQPADYPSRRMLAGPPLDTVARIGRSGQAAPPDDASKPAAPDQELRCTLCGLRACWTS